MAELFVTDLGYGHIGVAKYIKQSRTWHFGRELPPTSASFCLAPGSGQLLVGPDNIAEDEIDVAYQTSNWNRDTLSILEYYNAFARGVPELFPAVPLLATLEVDSRKVIDEGNTQQSTLGNLVAFGRVIENGIEDDSAIEVVAVRSAHDPSSLQISSLKSEFTGQDLSSEQHDFRESLDHGIFTTWTGPGAPLLQICFNPSSYAKGTKIPTLLLVRLLSGTYVLQVFDDSAMQEIDNHEHNESRVQLKFAVKLLAFIGISKQHGGEHLQVAFINSAEFVIIDSHSNFCIVKLLQPAIQAGSFKVKTKWRKLTVDTSEGPSALVSNTWAHLLPLRDVNLMVHVTRNDVSMVMEDGAAQSVSSELYLDKNGEFITDIMLLSGGGNVVLLLTTQHMLCIHIQAGISSSRRSSSTTSPQLAILASMRHFRDPQDMTLRVTASRNKEHTTVLIYSRQSCVVTVYRFRSANERDGAINMISNPSELILRSPSIHYRRYGIELIAMFPCPQTSQPESGSAQEPHTPDLLQIRVFYGDQSLYQYCLQVATPDAQDMQIENHPSLDTTIRDAISMSDNAGMYQRRAVHRVKGKQDRQPTNTGSARWPKTKMPNRVPKTLYRFVSTNVLIVSSSSTSASQGFASALMDVRRLLELRAKSDEDPSNKLSRIAATILRIDDVGETSDLVGSLFSTKIPGKAIDGRSVSIQSFALQYLIRHLNYDGIRIGEDTLLKIYNIMVQNFVTALPEATASKTRLSVERQCRSLATRLCLAGSHIAVVSDATDEAHQPFSKPSSSLPIFKLPPYPYHHSTANPSNGRINVPLDTPWSSSTDISSSLATSVQSQTPASMTSTTMKSHLDNLKQYTSFSQAASTISPLVKTPRCLAHWQIGQNPSLYSWTTTTAELQALDNAAELEALPEKERRRAYRKADRHQRRQEAEARKVEFNLSQPVLSSAVQSSQVQAPLSLPHQSRFTSSQISLHTSSAAPQVAQVNSTQSKMPNRQSNVPIRKRKMAGF